MAGRLGLESWFQTTRDKIAVVGTGGKERFVSLPSTTKALGKEKRRYGGLIATAPSEITALRAISC